jgi:hypothetical protein
VVSQGWLHHGWRRGFKASHLSWTTYPELQHLAVVKVHGVFPSNHGYSASSPRLQFHRIPRRDSAQVVTPFVQVGTSRFSSVSRGADYPFTLTNAWRALLNSELSAMTERNSRPAFTKGRRLITSMDLPLARQRTRSHRHKTVTDQSLRGQLLRATSHGITHSLSRRP